MMHSCVRPQLHEMQREQRGQSAFRRRKDHVMRMWWEQHQNLLHLHQKTRNSPDISSCQGTHKSHTIGGSTLHVIQIPDFTVGTAKDAVEWLDKFSRNGMGRMLHETDVGGNTRSSLSLTSHQQGLLLDTSVSRFTDCRISMHPKQCTKLVPCAMPDSIAKMVGAVNCEIQFLNTVHATQLACSHCKWKSLPTSASPVNPDYNCAVVYHLRGCLDESYPPHAIAEQTAPMLDHIDWFAPKTMSHVCGHEIFGRDAPSLAASVKDSPLFSEWGRVRSISIFVLDSSNADPEQHHRIFISSLVTTDTRNTEIKDAKVLGAMPTHIAPVFCPQASIRQRGSVLEQMLPTGALQPLSARQVNTEAAASIDLPVDGSQVLHIPPDLFDRIVIGVPPITTESTGCYIVMVLHLPISLMPEYVSAQGSSEMGSIPNRLANDMLHGGVHQWHKKVYPGTSGLQLWSNQPNGVISSPSDVLSPHLARIGGGV